MKKTILIFFLLFFSSLAFSLQVQLTTVPIGAVGNIPFTVTFTATATEGAPNYNYTWNFGDGSPPVIIPNSPNPVNTITHTYNAIGNYTARISVTDGSVPVENDSATTRVETYFLTVVLTADNTRINENGSVTFTANAAGGSSPYVFEWDYGDGTIETTNSPNNVMPHIYTTIGVYNAKVTVIDTRIEKAESAIIIIGVRDPLTGNVPPIANAGGPYFGEPGIDNTLNASASYDLDGTINQYRWRIRTTIGDPDCPPNTFVSAVDTQIIVCNGIGTAEVELRVRDNSGANNTVFTTITIREVQKNDIINIVKITAEPEVISTDDLTVIITARNVTNRIQDINLSYEVKDMAGNPVGITGLISNQRMNAFEQKDFAITISNAQISVLQSPQNYWVYATASAQGETNTTFNSRRTIFSYNEIKTIQVPETNFIGLLAVLSATLIILKNK
ncbi:MAG: PKD domain-containing protein [archaeon]